MKNLINKLLLSCLIATELIEKKLLFRLSFSEKLRLKIHKLMCKACALYEKQSIILDKALSGSSDKEVADTDLTGFKVDTVLKIEEMDLKSPTA